MEYLNFYSKILIDKEYSLSMTILKTQMQSSVTGWWRKIRPIFFSEKVAQTVAEPKKQNIYMKAEHENPKCLHQTTFET